MKWVVGVGAIGERVEEGAEEEEEVKEDMMGSVCADFQRRRH